MSLRNYIRIGNILLHAKIKSVDEKRFIQGKKLPFQLYDEDDKIHVFVHDVPGIPISDSARYPVFLVGYIDGALEGYFVAPPYEHGNLLKSNMIVPDCRVVCSSASGKVRKVGKMKYVMRSGFGYELTGRFIGTGFSINRENSYGLRVVDTNNGSIVGEPIYGERGIDRSKFFAAYKSALNMWWYIPQLNP
ncbi:MAG: hypothetical protein J4428_00145 [Candidatus Aenigmarchaeota archaeon]|nr:hypothetical protein [Candidatus Aenigmarchaeota archaeon]